MICRGAFYKTVNESLKVGEELIVQANCSDITNVSEMIIDTNNNNKSTKTGLVEAFTPKYWWTPLGTVLGF